MILEKDIRFDSYVSNNKQSAKEIHNYFLKEFDKASPIYSDAIPLFYPFVYSKPQIEYISNINRNLMDCIFSIPVSSKDNFNRMLKILGYDDDMAELLFSYNLQKDLELSKLFARSDFIIDNGNIRFLETNVSAPLGGMGIADRYYEIFERIKTKVSLKDINGFEPYINWGEGIKNAINKYIGKKAEEVKIILACWEEELAPDKSDASEGVYFLRKLGFNIEIASFMQLEMRVDGIYFNNERVDVIYGATLFNEIQESKIKKEIFKNIKRFHDRGGVLYLIPMLSNLFGNKGVYALLSDERYNMIFDNEKLKIFQNNIPWTRFLKEDRVLYKGKIFDLMDLLENRKDLFVLKPQVSFSGKGIYMGKDLSQEKWVTILQECIQKKYVVQEFVVPDIEELTVVNGDTVKCQYYKNCYGVLWFNNCFSGLFIRNMLEDGTDIINISRGSTYSVGFYKENIITEC